MTPKAKLFNHVYTQIGVSRRDITPPVDIYARHWGAAKSDQAQGIHRPFTATILSMRTNPDQAPLVLVAIDASWWQSGDDESFVRGGVLSALNLEPEQVMINLSHTHAGPSLSSDNIDKPGGKLVHPYLEHIRDQIIEAAREALTNSTDAELLWSTGCCDLAVHRNLPDPNGERYLTGYNPQGVADNTLLVGRVTDQSGTILATLVNYACHPTTLAWDNTQLSPDYIGAMRETVEAATAGAPCLFLLGACGELAPALQYVGDVAIADQHGRKLGLAVCATLEGMLEPGHDLVYEGVVESGAPLAVWHSQEVERTPSAIEATCINLPLPIKSEYPPLQTILKELESAEENYVRERLSRKAKLRRTLGDGDTFDFPIWLWRTGNVFFVGYPGEAFSWLQQELRQALPECHVIVMNVTNGSIGYLPQALLYSEDLYEVWQTPLERGCLERVRDACIEAIANLH